LFKATSPVLFFYFRHGDETKKSMSGLFRALLVQLLYQDHGLTDYFHQECSALSQSELWSLAKLQNLMLETLKGQRSCFIILDGLDECGQDKAMSREISETIIDWFDQQAIPVCQSNGSHVRLLLSGQRDGILDRRLSKFLTIGLDNTSSHKQDIRRFAESRAAEVQQRFSLSPSSQASIATKVTDAADGKSPDCWLL
jgi:hypothetical protein